MRGTAIGGLVVAVLVISPPIGTIVAAVTVAAVGYQLGSRLADRRLGAGEVTAGTVPTAAGLLTRDEPSAPAPSLAVPQ